MTNDGYDEGQDGALKEKMNIPLPFRQFISYLNRRLVKYNVQI